MKRNLILICCIAVLPFLPGVESRAEDKTPDIAVSEEPSSVSEEPSFMIEKQAEICLDVDAERPHDLAEDISDLLEMLKKESPEVYRRIHSLPRKELLEKILYAMDSGVYSAEKMPLSVSSPAAVDVRKGKLIADNSVLYLRLSALDNGQLRQMQEDLITAANIANKPIGLILDLRDASSGDYALVNRFRNFFNSDAETGPIRYFCSVPIVVIIGGKTSGAPELLALLLAQTKFGCIIGQSGSGRIFPFKTVSCCGIDWAVPQIADPEWDISPYPRDPIDEFIPYPQLPFGKIGKVDFLKEDSAVRHAVDLIRALNATKRK